MNIVNKFTFVCLCLLSVMCAWAQTEDALSVTKDTVPTKKTKVYLEHSNTLSFDKKVRPDAQILIGEVCFRHDSSYMYCDSAYFFEKTNSLEAFSNV